MSCGTWRRISPSSELQSPSSVNKCSMVYASDLPKIWQESHLSHPSHLSYLFLSHQCPTLQWLRRHLSFGSLRLTCCRLGRASALPPSVAPHGQHLPNSGRAETRRLAWLDWKHNRKIRSNSELNSAWTIDMNHDYHWLSLIILIPIKLLQTENHKKSRSFKPLLHLRSFSARHPGRSHWDWPVP